MSNRPGITISLAVLVLAGALIFQCGDEGNRQSSTPDQNPEMLSLFYAADSAFQKSNYAAALATLKRATAIDSTVPEIYFLRGRILAELNQFEKARAAFQKVHSLDPDYPGVWFRLGHTAFRQDRYQEALPYYKQEEGAIEAHRDRYSPEAYTAVLVQIGRCYTRMGKTDSALQVYGKVLSVDSLYAVAYADLGQLYKNEGEFERGLHYYQRALQLAPENLEYRYFFGYLLLQTGQPEEAVTQLQAVTDRQPWHYGAQYNLGLALSRIGKQAEGQRHLEIADTLQDLDYDIQTAQRTVRTFPNNAFRWRRLGDLLQKAGRLQEAVQAYQSACYLEPGNMLLRNKLANIYVRLGEPGQAISLYRVVLQHDSSLANVWVNLGVAYARSGQLPAARNAWETALRMDPDHQQARRYLAN